MNKFVYFLAVGLAFTVLQVGTVEAADCAGFTVGTPAFASCVAQNQESAAAGPPADASCAKTADGSLPPHCQTDSNAADHESAGTGHHPPGEDCANKPTPEETAACWDQQGGHMDHPGDQPGGPDGDHPEGEHHDGPPPGEDCANKPTPEETAACWGQQGGHMDHPGDQPGGPDGDHPPGEHHDGPPIDPRSGQPFTQADEDKFQKYADECEATQGLISQGSKDELIAEGFTAIMVDDLCKNGPQDAPPAP